MASNETDPALLNTPSELRKLADDEDWGHQWCIKARAALRVAATEIERQSSGEAALIYDVVGTGNVLTVVGSIVTDSAGNTYVLRPSRETGGDELRGRQRDAMREAAAVFEGNLSSDCDGPERDALRKLLAPPTARQARGEGVMADHWPYGDDTKPHNFIQWKGTDVCMDLYCKCGAHTHLDADFAYHVRCGKCGTIWQLACHVEMREVVPPLSPDMEPIVTEYDAEVDDDYDWRQP